MTLLIEEHPLMVLPGLAKAIGLNEAIVLQQIHYWTRENRHVIDGYSWTYNTVEEWQKQFPFWSNATIRRAVDSLVDAGLLLKRKLSQNRFDNTLWYAIDRSKLPRKASNDRFAQNEQIDLLISTDRIAQDEQVRIAQNEQITSTENTAKTSSKTTTCLTASALQEDGLEPDLASEFLAHRKRKKAPLTQRAWDAIKREAAKAGWSLQDAVTKVIERDWKSFEADWVTRSGNAAGGNRHGNFGQQDYRAGVAQDGSF